MISGGEDDDDDDGDWKMSHFKGIKVQVPREVDNLKAFE